MSLARPLPPRPKTFVWTPEQQAIFDWALAGVYGPQNLNGRGNLIIKARAGSGKTTTAKHSFSLMPEVGRFLYAVFNKRNQKEAEAKIKDPRVEVKTLNSLGQAFVRRVWSNARPDPDLEYERAERVLFTHTKNKQVIGACVKLVGFLKNTTVNPTQEDAYELAVTQDCLGNNPREDEMIVCAALQVLELSKVQEPDGRITFNDQVWLPVAMGWIRPWYDVVLIDEAQDMNLPQLLMAKGACKPTGRIAVIGDDRQAIYGFRGAVQNGMSMMKESLNAEELFLTVTQRNPKAVVALAQKYVPDFKAADGAPEGIVGNLNEFSMMDKLAPGDAILSRLNAPLMPLALALLRKQIPARIEGKDIGRHLSGMVQSMRANSVPHFVVKVQEWHSKQRERLEGKRNPEKQLEQCADIAATLIALSEGCNEVFEIGQRLSNLFADTDENSKPAVILSSVHKAKGLEWPRVFILAETFRRKEGSAQQDNSQESNVYYVAITRAQKELYFIAGKGEPVAKASAEVTQANLDAPAAIPAQQINVAPAAQAEPQTSSEQPVLNPPAQQLNPKMWLADGQGGYESAPTGCFWRTPGIVFAYGQKEYVSVKLSQSGCEARSLSRDSKEVRYTDEESGEKVSKTVNFTPRTLKVASSIGRDEVIRTLSEEELNDFLQGKRPVASGANQLTPGEEGNSNMAKKGKSSTTGERNRKDYSGRHPFIIKGRKDGKPKKEVYDACVAKWGWDTDKGKADFNRVWDNALKEPTAKKGKAAAPAKATKAKGKKTPPAPPAPKAPAPSAPPAAPAPAAPPAPPAPAAATPAA